MGKSWGHRIAKLIGVPDPVPPTPDKTWWNHVCSVGKCNERIEFAVEWDYVTGRRGRASYAQKLYCKKHAERFCKKHGIDITSALEMAYDRRGTADLSRMFYDRSPK